jgi:hypothetical protein
MANTWRFAMTAAILLRDDFEVRLFGSWRGHRAMPVRPGVS